MLILQKILELNKAKEDCESRAIDQSRVDRATDQ